MSRRCDQPKRDRRTFARRLDYSQLGLVEVAYQLRRINHRLKVFAAIRKEAYARLPQRTAMVQQYRGSAVDIV